ncbi:aminodeoxychorismate synthase component I [Corynebacterium pacaense]|uniref:aminodeoxychorismate synthase component I n=1 Tax=Corynebacterium pacaense TaxID=1816684 RepID=UPI0009BA44D5|nr:aminodeoxychorismate synthase component I [Corynebacterium pacaense]
MRTLIIDNYDSFTHNLGGIVERITGVAPTIVHNDAPGWDARRAALFDAVIISPGPGHPGRRGDFGICAEVIADAGVPILGVCLGHQGIALHHGAEVDLAPEPVHGRVFEVTHNGSELFDGVPVTFAAVRYHSMAVSNLPGDLEATAYSSDGVLMAFRHRTLEQWGVQFHPESIGGQFGERIIANFLALAARPRREVTEEIVDISVDPAAVFETFFAGSVNAFWLDDPTGCSYLGDDSGPHARVHSHRVGEGDFFSWLRDDLRTHRTRAGEGFRLGWVGYLGYELRDGTSRHRSEHPDAQLIFADRTIAVEPDRVRLLALGEQRQWMEETTAALGRLTPPRQPRSPRLRLSIRDSRPDYLDAIGSAQDLITRGESYEICLTTRISGVGDFEPLANYLRLRADNPTSHGSFLRFGDLAVLSSSPERFISITARGKVESKPIKGTRPRGGSVQEDADIAAELASNPKDRAENLMIVDLVRNDLAVGARPSSVRVDRLFDVETYATVHQLVSTVSAELGTKDPVDCVRALFPGGSMTGAPKIRTMEIIDALETGPRGIYSGGLGYFSLDGAVDLSMVIRTLVLHGDRAEYGVGGAILSLSDPEAEWEEIRVKARPLLNLTGREFP